MIRQLNIKHLNDVMCIIENVLVDMNKKNIYQWDEIYPDRDIIEKDIRNNAAFGYFENGRLFGYIALNDSFSPEYNTLNWKMSGKALIIHRLSVDPKKQGEGIAKKCIRFAEEYAEKHQFNSIRLDAFSHNPAALNLYDKSGYERIGTVNFRKGSFICYEKAIP